MIIKRRSKELRALRDIVRIKKSIWNKNIRQEVFVPALYQFVSFDIQFLANYLDPNNFYDMSQSNLTIS